MSNKLIGSISRQVKYVINVLSTELLTVAVETTRKLLYLKNIYFKSNSYIVGRICWKS